VDWPDARKDDVVSFRSDEQDTLSPIIIPRRMRFITAPHSIVVLGGSSSQRPEERINHAIEGLSTLEVDRVGSSRHAFNFRVWHHRRQRNGRARKDVKVLLSG